MKRRLRKEVLLNAALSSGGHWSELFKENVLEHRICMDNNKIEEVVAGEDSGLGIRLVYGKGNTAYAYTNVEKEEKILSLAQSLSKTTKDSPVHSKSLKSLESIDNFKIIKPIDSFKIAKKVDLVKAVESAARDVDKRIVQVKVLYVDRLQEIGIYSSLGVKAEGLRSYVSLLVHCTASEKSLVQTGYEIVGGLGGFEILEENDVEEIARIAARRALLKLKAEPVSGGTMTVILASSAGGTMIHEAVGHGLEGDQVSEGMSAYVGEKGKLVANPIVSVADDPTIVKNRGSYLFDDEGVSSQHLLLIENGVLKDYLHDRISALKLNTVSNGHGRRESYRFQPLPRMSNTMILPGKDTSKSIIEDTEFGLYVSKMGGGQVNTVNGDFVFEVSEGYLIQNGLISTPIRGAILAGNGPKVLKNIDKVADDLGWSLGTCGKYGQNVPVTDAQPTIRISELLVGGLQ